MRANGLGWRRRVGRGAVPQAYVPPYVPHQEINASPESSLSCVVVRSGHEPVVVNLDMPAVEPDPEQVHWVDDIHTEP